MGRSGTINKPANCSNSSMWGEGTQGNSKKLDVVQGSPGWVTPIQVKHLGGGNKIRLVCGWMDGCALRFMGLNPH